MVRMAKKDAKDEVKKPEKIKVMVDGTLVTQENGLLNLKKHGQN